MRLLVKLSVLGYQVTFRGFCQGSCRFYPSCSEYALVVLQEKNIFHSIWLIGKRLLKCNPFHPGGVDEPK